MKSVIRAVMAVGLASGLVLAGVWLGRADLNGLPTWWAGSAPAVGPASVDTAADSAARKPKYYRNPMGLPDISPVPKRDSMGMDYIPVFDEDASGPANTVHVSLDKVQHAGVRTEPARKRIIERTIRATGTVAPNERTLAVVTLKFPGFVEALTVQETGVEIRAGEPLMRVWLDKSEAYQRQVDYLLALRGAPPLDGGRGGLEAAERNLRLLDFPQAAIDQLRKSGEPMRSIAWGAPFSGTVLEKPAMAGMRFEPGTPLFRLANLSTVWVMAEVAERDLPMLKAGQRATVGLLGLSGPPIEGIVTFIYLDINPNTRTGKLRIELPNRDGRIKLGFYADVAIKAQASPAAVVAIPDSAVIDNGARRVALVAKGEGRFEPRELTLGGRGNGYVEVRQGVEEGEAIVVRGNFLIDAESNLRAALATLTMPPVSPEPK